MAIRSRNKISVAFSMSSMTDIVFLLLIFFIIVSTMVSPYGLNVTLPNSAERTTDNPQVTVSITPDSRFYIGGKEVLPEELEAELTSMLSQPDKDAIILKGDKIAPYGSVIIVMDIAKRNGFKLVLATSPN
jgi:biopolymer transport protein ExbD